MTVQPFVYGQWEPVLWGEDEEVIIDQIYGCNCDGGEPTPFRCQIPQCVMESDLEMRSMFAWFNRETRKQRMGIPSEIDAYTPVSDPYDTMTDYDALDALIDYADLYRKEQKCS